MSTSGKKQISENYMKHITQCTSPDITRASYVFRRWVWILPINHEGQPYAYLKTYKLITCRSTTNEEAFESCCCEGLTGLAVMPPGLNVISMPWPKRSLFLCSSGLPRTPSIGENEKDAARREAWNQYQKFVEYVATQMEGGASVHWWSGAGHHSRWRWAASGGQ